MQRRASRTLARDAGRWLVAGTRVVVNGATTLARLGRRSSARETIRPWMRFQRVEDVPWDLLAGQGVKAVLFDLENTLIPPGGPFTDEAREVVARVRRAGLGVGVVTNCAAAWARDALDAEGVEYVAPAHKPGREGFLEACHKLGVRPANAVFVGDQMITDVFGAQRIGMRAILLEPRWRREAMSSRAQRLLSKGLLRLVGSS